MSVFATPYQVQWSRWDPLAGTDAHGVPLPGWLAPVDVDVIGWGAPQGTEPKIVGQDRIEVIVELYVPPPFRAARKDRITINSVTWDVLDDGEHYDGNPFGWDPGSVINLGRLATP